MLTITMTERKRMRLGQLARWLRKSAKPKTHNVPDRAIAHEGRDIGVFGGDAMTDEQLVRMAEMMMGYAAVECGLPTSDMDLTITVPPQWDSELGETDLEFYCCFVPGTWWKLSAEQKKPAGKGK